MGAYKNMVFAHSSVGLVQKKDEILLFMKHYKESGCP